MWTMCVWCFVEWHTLLCIPLKRGFDRVNNRVNNRVNSSFLQTWGHFCLSLCMGRTKCFWMSNKSILHCWPPELTSVALCLKYRTQKQQMRLHCLPSLAVSCFFWLWFVTCWCSQTCLWHQTSVLLVVNLQAIASPALGLQWLSCSSVLRSKVSKSAHK